MTDRSAIVRLGEKMKKHIWLLRLLIVLVAVVGWLGTAKLMVVIDRYKKPFTPEDFFNRKLVIEIPVRYEIDMEMAPKFNTYEVMVTVYTNRKEETDNTPDVGADGRMVYEGSIAVSQDLYKKKIFPGELVYVQTLKKWFIVEDSMNQRLNDSIDIFQYKRRLNDKTMPKEYNGSFKSTIVVVKVTK